MLDAFLFWGSIVLLNLLLVGVLVDTVALALEIRANRLSEKFSRDK